MAIWIIIRKAIKIWFAVRHLKHVKLNSYRISRGLKPIRTTCECIYDWIKSFFKLIFLYLLCWPCLIKWNKSWKTSLWESLWITGSFAHETLKSFIGLLAGLLATHLTTLFLIYSLNISPSIALSWTISIGTFFSLGLAFTESVRCYTLLILPPLLFSKKGRVAMLGYILILALAGPGKNTAYNMEVLTESLVCSEEIANNATGGLIDLIKNPSSFLSKAIEAIVKEIKETSDKILGSLQGLIRIIRSIVDVILEAYEWLKSITEICNEQTGSPYDRCLNSFAVGIDDCKYHLSSTFSWLCEIAEFAKFLCELTKVPNALFCWFPSFIKQELYLPIKQFLKDFIENIKTFFIVGIHFKHDLSHSLKPSNSKSFKDIVHDMKLEIMSEMSWLLKYIDWMDLLISCFFLYGFIKAAVYKYRFLHSDRYDNFYLSKGLVKFDWERKLRGREYIFPLKYRESKLYVDNFSFQLLQHERKVLKYSLAIVAISSAKILSYLLLDVALFIFLELLRKHGAIRIEVEEQLGHSARILGSGFLADMYRGILHAFTPLGSSLPAFDTSPCLPIAREPDYVRYAVILSLLLFVFIGTLAEPFGLRLRHIICEYYYPYRILPRNRWMYFHILNSRGNFFSFAKNQLLARLTNNKTTFRISLIDRLAHTIPCFHRIVTFMGWDKKSCFLCGNKGDQDDYENFYHCPNCKSVFCLECYQDLENECPLCSTTMRIDAIDEEMGSSNDSDSDDSSKKFGNAARKKSIKNKLEFNKNKNGSSSSYKYSQLNSSSTTYNENDDDESDVNGSEDEVESRKTTYKSGKKYKQINMLPATTISSGESESESKLPTTSTTSARLKESSSSAGDDEQELIELKSYDQSNYHDSILRNKSSTSFISANNENVQKIESGVEQHGTISDSIHLDSELALSDSEQGEVAEGETILNNIKLEPSQVVDENKYLLNNPAKSDTASIISSLDHNNIIESDISTGYPNKNSSVVELSSDDNNGGEEEGNGKLYYSQVKNLLSYDYDNTATENTLNTSQTNDDPEKFNDESFSSSSSTPETVISQGAVSSDSYSSLNDSETTLLQQHQKNLSVRDNSTTTSDNANSPTATTTTTTTTDETYDSSSSTSESKVSSTSSSSITTVSENYNQKFTEAKSTPSSSSSVSTSNVKRLVSQFQKGQQLRSFTSKLPTTSTKTSYKLHYNIETNNDTYTDYDTTYEEDEDFDSQDEDGICHHHQHVDKDVYSKYSDVLTELESLKNESTSDDKAEDDTSTSSTETETTETSEESQQNNGFDEEFSSSLEEEQDVEGNKRNINNNCCEPKPTKMYNKRKFR